MTDLTPPSERARPVLVNLQALRFLAAALVVCHHVASALVPAGVPSPDAVADRHFPFMAGVDIFFVISGFIMQHTAGETQPGWGSTRQFLGRRIVRIVPLYWLFTSLMLALTLVAAGRIHRQVGSAAYVIASYLFIPWATPGAGPHPMPATGEISPLLGLGWTLNYEMLFYALFGAALLLTRRWRFPAIAAVLIGLVVLPAAMPIGNLQLRYYAHPIVLEFLFGIGLAMAFRRVPRSVWWLGLSGVGLLWLANTHGYPGMRPFYLGVPAALVCAGVAFAPEAPASALSRLGRLLGDASYALYLSHPFVLRAVEIAAGSRAEAHPALFAVVALSAAVVFSVVVHLWVEKPLTRMLRAGLGRLRPPASAAPSASPV